MPATRLMLMRDDRAARQYLIASKTAMARLTATATSPVREPETHTVAIPSIAETKNTTVDNGEDHPRASTMAPTVQNATTAPSLLASPSVPEARSMYDQNGRFRNVRSTKPWYTAITHAIAVADTRPTMTWRRNRSPAPAYQRHSASSNRMPRLWPTAK